MALLTKGEIAALSTQERLTLIDELWESLEAPLAAMTRVEAEIPDWQCRVLDERLHDLEKFPGDDVSLAEARNQSLL
jgi:hypothetical protein